MNESTQDNTSYPLLKIFLKISCKTW